MEINYFSANYLNFEQDFLAFYDGLPPLSTITDDLERAMSKDKPYFILPPQVAKDGRKHLFHFDVVADKYEYSHHKVVTSNLTIIDSNN